jgi:hypothetical protein
MRFNVSFFVGNSKRPQRPAASDERAQLAINHLRSVLNADNDENNIKEQTSNRSSIVAS